MILARKRLNSADRKKEIMNVVLDIIYEEGFYKLTIRNIADRIGISEAAIYRHFNNKKQIIDRLTDYIFKDHCWQDLDFSRSPFVLLRSLIRGQFELLEGNPRLTAVIFEEGIFREYDEIAEKISRYRKEKENKIIKIVEQGQETADISSDVNPQVFALLFMGAVRVSVIRWKENKFSTPLVGQEEEILEELFKLL